MNTAAHTDPFAFLYETSGPAPFPGYAPEGQFSRGIPVVVARYTGNTGIGYSSVMTETRYPAETYKATIYDVRRPLLEFSTGSGKEMGALLHEVCAAFAQGRVQLTPNDRFCHSVGIGQGQQRVTLCFSEPQLAHKVAGEMCSEMLGVKRLH